MGEIKSAYERALERLKSGEFSEALEKRKIFEITKSKEKTKEISNLVDDPQLEDFVSQGYACYREWVKSGEVVVRILPDEDKYNGIDSCLVVKKEAVKDQDTFVKIINFEELEKIIQDNPIATSVATVIPYYYTLQFMKNTLSPGGKVFRIKTNAERVKAFSDVLHEHYVIINVYGYTPTLEEKFDQILYSQAGRSNPHIPAFMLKAGECFHRSNILSAMIRNAGIPSRIVGFHEVPKEQWKKVCESLGEFRLQWDPQLIEGELPLIPEFLHYVMQGEFSDYGKDQTRDKEIMRLYVSGKKLVRLNPNNDTMREKYNHFWVEAKVEDGWTTYNTTRLKNGPDPVMDNVFEVMQPHKVIMPELRIVRAKDSHKVDCYFKDPTNF